MLHLKKKDNTISIHYREKSLNISKTLLTAGAVALAIHIFFWLLFSITSIKIFPLKGPNKPVIVTTEGIKKTAIAKEKTSSSYQIPIVYPDFDFPTSSNEKVIPLGEKNRFQTPNLDITFKNVPQIKLIGDLKELILLNKIPTIEATSSLCYEVQVDHLQGKIFWSLCNRPKNKKAKEGERILKELQFQPSDSLLTKGYIEVYFDD